MSLVKQTLLVSSFNVFSQLDLHYLLSHKSTACCLGLSIDRFHKFIWFTISWFDSISIHLYIYQIQNIFLKGIVHTKMKLLSLIPPSCRFKPVRPPFIFRTQFLYSIRELCPSVDSKGPYMINAQKHSMEIGKTIHVSSGFNCYFLMLREYFCMQENKNIDFIQQFVYSCHPIAPFWRISAGQKLRTLFCVCLPHARCAVFIQIKA